MTNEEKADPGKANPNDTSPQNVVVEKPAEDTAADAAPVKKSDTTVRSIKSGGSGENKVRAGQD